MSNLLQASMQCPWCGSSRGYSEYEENFYCYSCLKSQKKFMGSGNTRVVTDWNGQLPSSDRPTEEFIEYRDKYQLGDRIFYNSYYNSAIFPITYKNKLKCYQSRRFRGEPKWVTISHEYEWGKKFPYITKSNAKQKGFVIVEDIVSAYRLERFGMAVIALLGCKPNQKLINFLISKSKTFIVWLDGDRAGEEGAKKLLDKLKLVAKVGKIVTEKDPKDLDDGEIREELKNVKIK